MEGAVARFDQPHLCDRGVDDVGPVARGEDVEAAHADAGAERGPGAPGRAEAAVEAEDHDRAGGADPHRAGERVEHLVEVKLLHVVGAGQEEYAD